MAQIDFLLNNYSLPSLIIIIFSLTFAFKAVSETLDYVRDKLRKYFNLENDKEKNKKELDSLHESIADLKESLNIKFNEINDKLDKQEQNITLLQATDNITLERLQNETRSRIIDKHHYFCYKMQAIDDLSLQSLERMYMYYKNAGGNTFIEGLMDELRQLPRAILTKPSVVN
jgi:hypothetical protein